MSATIQSVCSKHVTVTCIARIDRFSWKHPVNRTIREFEKYRDQLFYCISSKTDHSIFIKIDYGFWFLAQYRSNSLVCFGLKMWFCLKTCFDAVGWWNHDYEAKYLGPEIILNISDVILKRRGYDYIRSQEESRYNCFSRIY